MGSLEAWLLLRSLSTLHFRAPCHSENAAVLAKWLNGAANGQAYDGIPADIIDSIWHSSVRSEGAGVFQASLRGRVDGDTLFIAMRHVEHAILLPHSIRHPKPSSSLGGVESVIEQQITVDASADPRVIRFSIGVENIENLKDNLRQAFLSISKPKSKL